MIERYVEAVSTYARDVDDLIWLVAVLVGFWFVLSEVVFFGFIFGYRRREGRKAEYITGEEKELKRWITIPHLLVLVCDVFIIVGAVRVWVDIKQTLPDPDSKVRVVAQQWAWTFVQPGPDGTLDTADDITTIDELNIAANKTYHYELTSLDVLHSFSVPVFRLKQDAIPGRVINGWFEAQKTGSYDVQCTEICGIGHGLMPARVNIRTPEEHVAWMAQHGSTQLAAAGVRPPGR